MPTHHRSNRRRRRKPKWFPGPAGQYEDLLRSRRRNRAHLFKRRNGTWKHFRGNPFKKNIVRGQNALKHGIAVGHFDRKGRFHRRKNMSVKFGGPGAKGKFHPWRWSPDYKGPGGHGHAPAWFTKRYGAAGRVTAKKRTTKRKAKRRRR